MASNFAEKYLNNGKTFPSGTPFLMPGLGVVKKAQPPSLEQVNQSCALAFQDSLSQVGKLCASGKTQPKFVQLLFAQAFMVGPDLHCLCVIQWEVEAVKKAPARAAKSKAPVKAAVKGKKPAPAPARPKPRQKAKR